MAKPFIIPARVKVCSVLRAGGKLFAGETTGRRFMLHNERGELVQRVSLGLISNMVKDGLLTQAGDEMRLTPAGVRYMPDPAGKRLNRQTPGITLYLGKEDVMVRRLRALDELAEPYGGRSRLLQMIADGEFNLTRKQK